ncbi:MAG: hypothetical protein Q4G36_08310 [Paracoccus sp. (in: a-proteobacteria)]|nr:hypothetical protein [Paracoccus sp. (in: a-proteobacteria)]
MRQDDGRLNEAKATPIRDVALRLELTELRPAGGELIGPCPKCGGIDRFGINPDRAVFLCRRCGVGGDQVALVQHVLGIDFRGALDWLIGPAETISEAERARRAVRAAEARAKQDRIASAKRARAIDAARDIWHAAQPAEDSIVRDYLARRGLGRALWPDLPATIRFAPALRFTHPDPARRGEWVTLHEGPAMVCAVTDPSNRVTAVHRTWIDLDQPGGKVLIPDPADPARLLPAKKVLGSKKGGAIRLRGGTESGVLVMGEGVETTASAMVAVPDALRGAAFWAGVDLGNMAGRMLRVPKNRWSGEPDMSDSGAFVPPQWVRELIFIRDGDSDRNMTLAKLQAGLRRAIRLRPGLVGRIVDPGDGVDLNDILMGKG